MTRRCLDAPIDDEVIGMRGFIALVVLLVAGVVSAVPAAATPTDKEKPKASFTTESGDVLVSAPTKVDGVPMTVTGRATDDFSGVTSVRVVYCAGGRSDGNGGWTCGGEITPPIDPVVQRNATVTCTNASRRSCTFSAGVPDTPGSYLVLAAVEDASGKSGAAKAIQVYVVGGTPHP